MTAPRVRRDEQSFAVSSSAGRRADGRLPELLREEERRIFFEWALIAGRNDSPEQAHAGGRLLRDPRAQVNLIPLHPFIGYHGALLDRAVARCFQDILAAYGLPSAADSTSPPGAASWRPGRRRRPGIGRIPRNLA